ncbi:hypothetical protein HJC23_003383 [Cyclotella cryptica]|uniref:Uncharacterized protein n=1 Tax=Cyclotella cryptica TaxID=29204 RepID=A0ABD3R9F6_9STRA
MTDVMEIPIDDKVQVVISDNEVDAMEEDVQVPTDDDQVQVPLEDNEVQVSIEEELQVLIQEELQIPIQNEQVQVPRQIREIQIPPQNNPLQIPTYHNEVTKPPPSSSNSTTTPSKSIKRLPLNTLNVLAYILNLSTSYLGGVSGWFGGKPNSELSSQYQTLLTPPSSFFVYIWGIIFLFQGLFVAAQILPWYKDHVLVQRGVNVWYGAVCLVQSIWTVAFGYEFMVTAFVFMVGILICLLTIVNLQWRVISEEERGRGEREVDPWLLEHNAISAFDEDHRKDTMATPPSLAYWLLRFPFAVHAGWIAPATPLMLSVMLVSFKVDTQVELWTAVLGVAVLFGMCMGLLLRQDKGAPSYVIPGVVAYACVGIMFELGAPSDAILGRFQEGEISLMKNVAGFSGATLLVTIVSRFFAILLRDHCCRRKYDDDEDDNVIYVEADDL